jgi:uncharacterized protein (TIGR02147 family)
MTLIQDLYNSEDYRQFLREHFREEKRVRKAFSHRYFARIAGFKSSGFLSHVMEGERNLTEASARKICKALGFKGISATFFETLVLFNQAPDSAEKLRLWKILERYRKRSPAQRLNTDEAAGYFKEWYHPAIRELAVHARWGNFGQLGSLLTPAISAEKAEKAISALLNLGLLTKNTDGGYQQSTPSVISEGVSVKLRRNFRIEMMFRAVEAMDSLGPASRHLSGLTVSMSEESFAKVSALLDELRRKALELAEQDEKVDRVYHFNFQGFPLSTMLSKTKAKARNPT